MYAPHIQKKNLYCMCFKENKESKRNPSSVITMVTASCYPTYLLVIAPYGVYMDLLAHAKNSNPGTGYFK